MLHKKKSSIYLYIVFNVSYYINTVILNKEYCIVIQYSNHLLKYYIKLVSTLN